MSNISNSEYGSYQKRDTNTSETRDIDAQVNKRKGHIHMRNEIPHGRGDRVSSTHMTNNVTSFESEPVYAAVEPRRSVSADLLSEDTESSNSEQRQMHPQGVIYGDFARSNDTITPRSRRSQSLKSVRPDREKRLERRNRALSAEIKLTKDHFLSQSEQNSLNKRTNSVDSSNSGLYADNRMMPTKFSLRTPVRQVGTPSIPSIVPVKAISSLPMFQPPPKPPRIHSVTIDDLKSDIDDSTEQNYEDTLDDADSAFADDQTAKPTSLQMNSDEQTLLKEVLFDTNTTSSDGKKTDTVTKLAVENNINDQQVKRKENNSDTEMSALIQRTGTMTTRVSDLKMTVQESPVVRCHSRHLSSEYFDLKNSASIQTDHSNACENILVQNKAVIMDEVPQYQESMNVISSPVIKQERPVFTKNKQDDKKNAPIPKARTSIKASSDSNKLPEADCKSYTRLPLKDSVAIASESSTAPGISEKVELKNKENQLNKDDFSVLKVDLPPLKTLSVGSTSPSFKILNRRENSKELDRQSEEVHEVTNTLSESVQIAVADSPVISASCSQSVEYNGARPKTTSTVPKALLSRTAATSVLPLPNNRLATPGDVSNSRKGHTGPGVDRKQDICVHKVPPSSRSNSKPPDININKPIPPTRIGSNFPLSSSVRVPSRSSSVRLPSQTASNASAMGDSQGVLHLPQTQFSRQVARTEAPNTVNNSAPANVQNYGNQINNNTDNHLFSRLL